MSAPAVVRPLVTLWPVIKKSLEVRGFAVVSLPDSEISTLKAVASLFGPIQRHVRNPIDGITEIAGNVSSKKGQVDSCIEFFPHTDGHYLRGMAQKENGKFYCVQPPHLFLLQCVKQAPEGGINVLVDGAKILRDLIAKDKKLIGPLFSGKGTAIRRGEHLVCDVPVFSRLSPQTYALRFSYDRDFYCTSPLKDLFARFNAHYVLNQQYSSYHLLKPCQILIADNERMLHGRTAFVGERVLRRVWIHKKATQLITTTENTHFESQPTQNDPLQKFAAYSKKGRRSIALPPINTGIHLSNEQDQLLRNHLKRLI
jgi:hypothetical protein